MAGTLEWEVGGLTATETWNVGEEPFTQEDLDEVNSIDDEDDLDDEDDDDEDDED